MERAELTDAQWQRLEPLLPPQRPAVGRPNNSHRQVVEGILSFGPDAVTASFVDVLAERDPDQLAELARLIEARMKDRENG